MAEVNDAARARPPRELRRTLVAAAALACCAVFSALSCARARADADSPPVGITASGLRGLVYTGLPVVDPELNLSAAAGYGFTEPFEPVPGAHHRAQGSLGAALAPLPWLAFALRLDGRLELHPDDGDGAHSAGFGDPRLFARAGHALSPAFALGAELGLWLPGNDAPSFELSAATPEARALIAWTPEHSPWSVLGALGVRLDNSSSSAPDLDRLRLGDRIALGLSDSNALLAALGVARRLGDGAELFAELSMDMLVGADAPDVLQSPLRAALGARAFLSRALSVELTAIASLSQRPDVAATDPLVPIEPRVLGLFALRYHHSFTEPEDDTPDDEPPARASSAGAAAPAPQLATVAGTIVDEQGAALPEVKVTLVSPGSEPRETITDAEGRYSFTDTPHGPATLEAKATGFATQSWQLDVQPKLPESAPLALAPKADVGMVRGLIRSFTSEPLRARIELRDRRGKLAARGESGSDGSFELEVAPGRYKVTIDAKGFRKHSRSVNVDANGVAILNVDMREQK